MTIQIHKGSENHKNRSAQNHTVSRQRRPPDSVTVAGGATVQKFVAQGAASSCSNLNLAKEWYRHGDRDYRVAEGIVGDSELHVQPAFAEVTPSCCHTVCRNSLSIT